ncbi:unnamed protein product [Gadus morhua 'NCC']
MPASRFDLLSKPASSLSSCERCKNKPGWRRGEQCGAGALAERREESCAAVAVAAAVAAAAVVVEACGVCVKHSHHGCEAGCDSALSRNNRFPGDTWAATEEAFETNKQVSAPVAAKHPTCPPYARRCSASALPPPPPPLSPGRAALHRLSPSLRSLSRLS